MNTILEQINSAGYVFVEFALPMLVQASVLIVVLLLADLLLRKKVRAVFRYWLWMLVLLKLVLPTTLSSPVSLGSWFGDELATVKLSETSTSTEPVNLPQIVQAHPPEEISIPPAVTPTADPELAVAEAAASLVTWQGIVFLVWAAVVAAMGLLLLQRAIFVNGLVAQAKNPTELMNDAFRFCCGQMGLKGKVGLKVSPNAASPAVCGLFRPVILLPQNLAPTLGSSHLRPVLLHELAHVSRGDLWVNLVQTILQIIYFYNPLLWLANSIIRRIREQAVDEAVQVAMGANATQYPQMLVDVAKMAFSRPVLSLRLIGVVESKSQLKGRIKRMLNQPIPKTAKLGFVGAVVVALMGLLFLPMANAEKQAKVIVEEPRSTVADAHPVVVNSSPKTYSNDVSADLKEITVTFNQPMMDKSWSWVQWDAPYPETVGSPYYDNEKRTCTLPVKLEPGKAYLVAFNLEPYIGFVNTAGEPAKPYVLVFATKGKDGKLTPIPEELIIKAKSINERAEIPYTQEVFDDIQPDGTILFKNTIRQINQSDREITSTGFINSDFVHVTGMSDAKAMPIKFTSTHEKDIYRYKATFNEPVLPGEVMEYTSEGTMEGLVKPVPASKDTFQYSMTHWPATDQPTRRVETYLLPAGAELISTTPEDMQRRIKDGRTELHVGKTIPAGGSITTAFQYRLTDIEKIVEQTVMTISTCAESDPRVKESLESLQGLDEQAVVKEVVKFLDSDKDTIRRSAIYILWKGGFKNIELAVSGLQKLCSHKEDFTRGMAALALGTAKVGSSFDVLCNMTSNDSSPYARRCAAYALGLMGNPEAKDVLEKALKDSDFNVRKNAEAALTMLSQVEKPKSEKTNMQVDVKDPGENRSSRRPKNLELSNDDGSSAGKRSIAASGHAVRFEAPSDECTLKAVRIYGSRYGEVQAPKEDFHVWLCDSNFKVIEDFPFPYSKFKRGAPEWVTLRVKPAKLPKQFIICAGFDPHQTKGVYVHYDDSSSGNSFTGLPGGEMTPFKDGDWMIRAVLADSAGDESLDAASLQDLDSARPDETAIVPEGRSKSATQTKPPAEQNQLNEAVYKQLDEIVDLSKLSPEMPFAQAIEQLKNSVDPPLKIVVLWRDLSDNAGIDQTTPINMDAIPAVRLDRALKLLLKAVSGNAELDYAVEDGMIFIATIDSLPTRFETSVYDISDLVGSAADAGDIARLVINTVEPQSWVGAGGRGTLTTYNDKKLIVYQTREIHKQIRELLQGLQVSSNDQGESKTEMQ